MEENMRLTIVQGEIPRTKDGKHLQPDLVTIITQSRVKNFYKL